MGGRLCLPLPKKGTDMYEPFNIKPELQELATKVEEKITDQIKRIDENAMQNSIKVLKAFQDNKVADMHFNTTTGYGYADIGRDTIEAVFAQVLGAEDALVRNQFISGTHALTVTLFGLLRPGDTFLSISGKPYDTLDEVIGIQENKSSLKAFGINYEAIELAGNDFDYEAIQKRVQQGNIKVIEIQRSKGYSTRESLTIEKLEKVIKVVKKIEPSVIIMIDNCYCEFVETVTPLEVGADIMVGSLIKNLGGGIAPNGAYVAGKKELIELVAERLTVPGQGKEVGPSLGANKNFLQGLYMAPSVVASSLKTAVFTSCLLEELGYTVSPRYCEPRADIVQNIEFGNADKLIKYCQGIQMGSAIDSNSIPEACDMPGYTDPVIMASGSFVQGSSIEISCDGPVREPYIAYQQGGLTYEYGKLAVLIAVNNMEEK